MNANDPVVMNNDALHNDVEATTTESPSPFLDHEAVASVLEYGNPSMEPFGAGLAAGCRLLQNRYHLPAETALLLNAAVIATAVGPAARVRNPWGTDLSASLELTFCAGPQHTLTAAIADAFRVFRQTVSHKLQWREAAGSRRLRAEFVEILQALERVETELCRTAASLEPTQFQPPASFPRPDPKPEERLAHSRLEHQELLARREHLRGELAERRLDLLPFLVGEDPGWDTLQSLDKLAFDHCFTALSPDGATLRELLACSTRELRKITRLMQASRHGRDLTEGASLLLHPMLITLQVVRPELLRAALQHPGVRAGGFLDGPILEVLAASTRLEVEAFVEDADEKPWHELLGRLFIRRSRGPVRLYRLDRAGFNILEDFHQWCQQTGTAGAVHPESAGFLSGWPAMLLKLALCLHLAAGKGEDLEEDTLAASALEAAAALLRSVGAKQLQLLERLTQAPAPAEPGAPEVARMVGKLKSLGGSATQRELFRCYGHQDYTVLGAVLERAVAAGDVIRTEGTCNCR